MTFQKWSLTNFEYYIAFFIIYITAFDDLFAIIHLCLEPLKGTW